MEDKDVKELDDRIRELEKQFAAYEAILVRNTEILDDIRTFINRPFNATYITIAFGVVSIIGTLLYGTYLAPIEERVSRIEVEMGKREAYIVDYQNYMKRMAMAGNVEGENRLPKE